ncbi:tetratricopeptide repeat protein [Roseivirga echinicomitans]
MKKVILGVFVLFLTVPNIGHAQIEKEKVLGDTAKYLLLNINLQKEITDAVDYMYNFDFHKAEVEFNWIKYNFPEHPLGYFLFGISNWWQMMPNMEKESPQLGDKFLAYMDTAITKAQAMVDVDKDNIEANFFLAGAYGFQGRYHSEKRNWGRATNAGRLALKYLERTQGNESFSPEILFGDALFNYYSVWIREQYPLLRPVLMFFPKGDKNLGVEQLKTVSTNAFYTRVEAVFFLMRIQAFELNETFEALRWAEYMNEQYPKNPYFHRFYAQMLYTAGRFPAAEQVSLEIMSRIEKGVLGYEEMSGRYASFYLADINRKRNNWEKAEPYYLQTIAYSSALELEESGYHLYSLLHLSEYYIQQKRFSEASPMLDKIRSNSKRKEDTNQKARALEKEIKRANKGNLSKD